MVIWQTTAAPRWRMPTPKERTRYDSIERETLIWARDDPEPLIGGIGVLSEPDHVVVGVWSARRDDGHVAGWGSRAVDDFGSGPPLRYSMPARQAVIVAGVQTPGARAAEHGIRRRATRASAGTEPVGRYR